MCLTPSAISCSINARLPESRVTPARVPHGTVGANYTFPFEQEVHTQPMLWALVVLLLLLWIGGFTLNVAGGLIHLLLVLAIIVAIYNLVVSRGRAI
jgi:hypothetical protein